ncbi:28S ribosomal protein S18a, mitochondrial-like [Daphnia pulicaria]|uniref:28S ribosomal protein S18a, mitochondrial-like n=1 Tax=Daphnia pulicaria TaxID=35523 RepID=UPI001EEA6070|nr:28S ribosomal protein S18a, mitochondrial-like [Daphnia pulicaria]
MALRNLSQIGRKIFERNVMKTSNIFAVSTRNIKQVTQNETPDGTVVIAGSYLPSSRVTQLVTVKLDSEGHCNSCYMCKLNLDVKHTDVLILSQFVRTDGCMLPRRVTNLCKRQQKRIGTMVTMAQKAGLMSNINPSWSHKDPRKRFQHKKWNSYWDETTIKC